MKTTTKILLNESEKDPFIELFHLKDLTDDSIFSNYQRYDFYQLLWFTKVGGNNVYFLDFKEYIMKEDQIILVFPGQIDKLDIREKEGYLFAIHNDVLFDINLHLGSDYLNGYFSNVVVTLDDDKIKRILESIVELLWIEYNSGRRLTLMQSYMEAFLFHVDYILKSSVSLANANDNDNITDPLIAGLMRLIDENFIIQRETEFYARKLGVSNRKVNEISKKGTGKTIKQHLQERLILEIKKEIKLQRKSLKEIAYDLGFSEPAYFTRFFKEQTSQTPKEFRDS
ncbi:AraC family transcriptional regulator [Dysgonomonas sp. 521]|uniref:helix-turn-helix domain-containing protein n=1 Tax=Dysgonomonas sp. 521 TaxID=2302932 RepID=UPI0013D3D0CB|nr:helix-turn-helix domain-containing protein [Dysgonomonas sp. 521]NDV95815.1 AraC family transcriptional regulator [Dysgonomonas sp. 521]